MYRKMADDRRADPARLAEGHVEGDPDAVIDRLADLLPLVDGWSKD